MEGWSLSFLVVQSLERDSHEAEVHIFISASLQEDDFSASTLLSCGDYILLVVMQYLRDRMRPLLTGCSQ